MFYVNDLVSIYSTEWFSTCNLSLWNLCCDQQFLLFFQALSEGYSKGYIVYSIVGTCILHLCASSSSAAANKTTIISPVEQNSAHESDSYT